MTDEGKHQPFVKKALPDEGTAVSTRPARTSHQKDGVAEARQMKKDEKRIEKELQEIYENSDGSMPDMRQFERTSRRSMAAAVGTLAASFVFLGTVVWAGFFFFQPTGAFQEDDVTLSVSGETRVPIGGRATYRIRYRNNQRVDLTRALLTVRFPAGFVLEESSRPADNDAKDEWALGAVRGEDSGFLDITGRFYGTVGEAQSFRAFFTYTPSNFNSEFQKAANVSVVLDNAPIDILVDAPKEVVAGADAIFTASVKPRDAVSELGLPPLFFEMFPPASFTKKASTPAADSRTPLRWPLNAETGEGQVRVTGIFAKDDAATSTVIRFAVVGRKPGDKAGDVYTYAMRDVPLSLAGRDIAARLVVNGSSGDFSVSPGDVLRAAVSVENNGKTAMKGVQARVFFDAPSSNNKSVFDWNALDDRLNGSVVGEQISSAIRRGSITWTAKEIPALRELAPGAHTEIEFSLPIKSSLDETLSAATAPITAVVDVQYEGAGGKELLRGNQILLTLAANASLAVDDTVTAGQNGAATHTVTWTLANSFHSLKDIRIEGEIYGETRWNADGLSVPGGKAAYDEKRKMVVWTIPEMPESVDVLPLRFAITFDRDNPTQKFLTGTIKGRAIDAVTGKEVLFAADEIVLHE